MSLSIWSRFEVKNWDSSAADQSQNKIKSLFHLGSLTQPQGCCIMSASSLLAEADLTAYRNPAFFIFKVFCYLLMPENWKRTLVRFCFAIPLSVIEGKALSPSEVQRCMSKSHKGRPFSLHLTAACKWAFASEDLLGKLRINPINNLTISHVFANYTTTQKRSQGLGKIYPLWVLLLKWKRVMSNVTSWRLKVQLATDPNGNL